MFKKIGILVVGLVCLFSCLKQMPMGEGVESILYYQKLKVVQTFENDYRDFKKGEIYYSSSDTIDKMKLFWVSISNDPENQYCVEFTNMKNFKILTQFKNLP